MRFLRHQAWLGKPANTVKHSANKPVQDSDMRLKNAACLSLPAEITQIIHQFSHSAEHYERSNNGTSNMQ